MAPRGKADDTLGGGIGPKIAMLVAQAMHDHLRESGEMRADIGAMAAVKFWQTVEHERDTHWTPLIRWIIDTHADLPDELLPLLEFAAHGHGEGAAMSALNIVGGLANATLGGLIVPYLRPTIHAINYGLQNELMDPGSLAGLAARGFIPIADAVNDAAGSGLPNNRMEPMIEAARSRPSPGELIEFLRRKIMDDTAFDEMMGHLGYEAADIAFMRDLAKTILSPEDVVLADMKNVLTKSEAETIAEESGVDKDDYATLYGITGEPPAVMMLLEGFRRGFIDTDELQKGIKQGRSRDEWIPFFEKMRFERASPADAINATVQGHLTEAEGKQHAEIGGLDPEDWEWMLETYGSPASFTQMIDLWRRKEATQDDVEKAIKEGHNKDKYVPFLIKLKRQIPALFETKLAVEKGGLPGNLAMHLLEELGYEPDICEAMVAAAESESGGKQKQPTGAQIQSMYEEHSIGRPQAEAALEQLKYTPEDVALILGLSDLKREHAKQKVAIAPIRTSFLDGHVGVSEAEAALRKLGISEEQISYEIGVWKVDKEARKKELTEAQIIKANTLGLITDSEAGARLVKAGYSQEDALLLLNSEKDRETAATGPFPEAE